MPRTSKTTVTQDSDGYYRVRIPKQLGDAMNLGGAEVEWQVESSKKLSLEKTND